MPVSSLAQYRGLFATSPWIDNYTETLDSQDDSYPRMDHQTPTKHVRQSLKQLLRCYNASCPLDLAQGLKNLSLLSAATKSGGAYLTVVRAGYWLHLPCHQHGFE